MSESAIISILAKFVGFIYFLPYRDAVSTIAISCPTHRRLPLDLTQILTASPKNIKFLVHLNWIANFLHQAKSSSQSSSDDLSMTHLTEFDSLGYYCQSLMKELSRTSCKWSTKIVAYANLMIITNILTTNQSSDLCIDLKNFSEVNLSPNDIRQLAPQVAQINIPVQTGQSGVIFQINRTLTDHDRSLGLNSSTNVVTFQKKMEEAFFRSHPSSLQRTVEFVTERVTSNCVKDFRNNLIPDIIRDAKQKVVTHLEAIQFDPEDEMKKSMADFFISDMVEKCSLRAVRHSLAKSVEFCEKGVKLSLAPLMGCDIPQEVIQKCEKIAQRDAVDKCAEWFKSSIPVIVKRDGRGAFERTKRKILPKNDQIVTSNDLIYPIFKNLRVIAQNSSKCSFNELEPIVRDAKEKIQSFDATGIRCFNSLFFQILFDLFSQQLPGLQGLEKVYLIIS